MKSKRWYVQKQIDQGGTKMCVSIAVAHELMTPPCVLNPATTDIDWIEKNIHWPAQKNDEWEGGSYPGAKEHYEGATLESVLSIVKNNGWITGCYFARTFKDFLDRLSGFRPAIVEISARESVLYPDAEGRILNEGNEIGGHCMLADEVDFENKRVWFCQSAPFFYGINGRVWMTFDDLKSALIDGQAVFLEGRKA